MNKKRVVKRGKKNLAPEEYIVDSPSAISEYIKHRPSRISKIYYKEKSKQRFDRLMSGVSGINTELLAEDDDRYKASLYAMVSVEPMSEKQFENLVEDTEPSLILALDHVTDPRNLGAIARSAAFFGVSTIMVPKDRQVLFTNASVSTSQGAFALCDLSLVTNLSRSLTKLKKAGYWIVGADMNGEELEQVAADYDKVVLVLGAEGNGLSQNIKKNCDRIISVSGAGDSLNSLNVSVAAGILLRGYFQQKKIKL